jgi:hypothetical protein
MVMKKLVVGGMCCAAAAFSPSVTTNLRGGRMSMSCSRTRPAPLQLSMNLKGEDLEKIVVCTVSVGLLRMGQRLHLVLARLLSSPPSSVRRF